MTLLDYHGKCLRWTRRFVLLALLSLAGMLGLGVPLEAAPQIELQPVVSGLANPVAITHAGDGSSRLFITLQAGQIVIFDGTQVLLTPFLDNSTLVSSGGERGLLSVAFHPNYRSNGLFFVNYTNTAGDTVIARYSVSQDPNVADPGSAAALLTIQQPFANHNGGQLQFGPDGYLYIGMGDGGSGGDPFNNGQNLGTLLGKLLRIDVNGASPYAIPGDNPFVGVTGALPEIWAYGLRNPWRFSFDRSTGDLFMADVGQNSWEEVDFQPAGSPGGQNYGWNVMEGNHCFNPPSSCNSTGLTLPILEYAHGSGDSTGCSISGGYRYRGIQNPDLTGIYFYGDLCTGRIWGASQQGTGAWTTAELLDTSLSITTFGEDEAGEVYVAHYAPTDGAIYRIVQTGSAPPAISLSVTSLSSSCTQGSNASSQTFQVWNSGGGTLSYSISVDASWLSCSPPSGTSTDESDTITVTYSTSGLSAGTHSATITITAASGASNSPQTIPVSLTVNAPAATGGDGGGGGGGGGGCFIETAGQGTGYRVGKVLLLGVLTAAFVVVIRVRSAG